MDSTQQAKIDSFWIFVVDDDLDQRVLLTRWLEANGYPVRAFPDGESCIAGLSEAAVGAVCLDLNMPGWGGLATLERIKAHHPFLPVIMLTADDSAKSAVRAMKIGSYDYLVKPVDRTKLLTTVANAVKRRDLELRVLHLEREAASNDYEGIVGSSPSMLALFRTLDRLSTSDTTALIQGESGTGKELIARAIHARSERRNGPFVPVNCAAIPENLVESELFGHERGAFTGAAQRRTGKFENANRGTLFLDEIGELAAPAQAKLLRALQERRFERVGGTISIESDFRLLAATHRHLEEDIQSGRFREDLYFRVAVFEVEAPALRDRREDILVLVKRFLADFTDGKISKPPQLDNEVIDLFSGYAWPGNVRELQNVIQHALVLAQDGWIHRGHLPRRLRSSRKPEVTGRRASDAGSSPASLEESTASIGPSMTLAEIERQAVESALRRRHGNVSQVIRDLSISRARLYRMLERYGLQSDAQAFRKAAKGQPKSQPPKTSA